MTHYNDHDGYSRAPNALLLHGAGLALALSTSLTTLLAASSAAAQSCGETTCPKGFTCETSSSECPTIDCAGPDCRPCVVTERYYCAPAVCDADADCGDGMICADYARRDCSLPATPTCPANSDCGDGDLVAPETSCTPTLIQQCTPRWQAPCQVASDCGPGFTCEELESCSSEPCPSPEMDCRAEVTCEPSGVFSCRFDETTCTTDADCEDGWTCGESPNQACTDAAGDNSCEPAGKVCQPPYYTLTGGGAVEDAAAPGLATDGDLAAEPALGENSDTPDASAESGCSTSGTAPGMSSLLLSALGIAAAAAWRRRR